MSRDKHWSRGSQVPTCLNGVGGPGSGGVLSIRGAPSKAESTGVGGIQEIQRVDRPQGLVRIQGEAG